MLNRYAVLGAGVSAGATSFTVGNIADLNSSTAVTNGVNPYATAALAYGDLVMIIQMQGADISTADDSTYGVITAYNNTGNYEVKQVLAVSGNTISVCGVLTYSYGQGGRTRTQVIRIPRLTTLNIAAPVVLSGPAWNGTSGGVIALETNGDVTIAGSISANALGFRGGTDPSVTTTITSGSGLLTLYRTTATNNSAGKGESIVGTIADYTGLNGANGRGAPANGGGGGNGHNGGGGGGSNAGIAGQLTGYNGSGSKPNQTTPNNWNAAWDLESANFHSDVSPGGGRGGYTYSSSNQDAITLGPGNTAWGGDNRNNSGGFGGRPLDYNNDTRLFLGGGAGAGDANNSAAGTGGGAGGGIVYLLTNGNVSGTGTITSNGAAGGNTTPAHNDAPGGGGGGGAIVLLAQGTVSSVGITANGGNGGNQLITSAEAEGAGAGGGGGFILSVASSATKTVSGGANGTSTSSSVTEFAPNGTTAGSPGTIATATFADIASCATLPARFQSIATSLVNTTATISWHVSNEADVSYYVVERSVDGVSFTVAGVTPYHGVNGGVNSYQFLDSLIGSLTAATIYYRIKQMDNNGSYFYSSIVSVRSKSNHAERLLVTPNPITGNTINLKISVAEKSTAIIRLIDATGKTILQQKHSLLNGRNTVMINNGNVLRKGVYHLQVLIDDKVTTAKVIVQ